MTMFLDLTARVLCDHNCHLGKQRALALLYTHLNRLYHILLQLVNVCLTLSLETREVCAADGLSWGQNGAGATYMSTL